MNRGPDSLGCLRFVKSLGDRAVSVFGNHDLHLLCLAEGVEHKRKRDTLEEVLAAPDRADLIAWLRHRPMLHVEGEFVLVHAGLLPEWTVDKALELAHEVEERLRGPDYRTFLARMYGDEPARWDDSLTGVDRLRVIVNAMTRIRVCKGNGAMNLDFKGEPREEARGTTPWFDIEGRRSLDHTIVFGHWSALGLVQRSDVVALDSGCVWGRSLTAMRLEDRRLFQVPCSAA